MRKIVVAILALAIAIAFSPITELQAAGVVGPGSKVESEAVAQVVKAKRKWVFFKKKGYSMKRGKRAKSKRAGACGTYMYYSKKARKCVDARNKR